LFAYNLQLYQLAGGPNWIESDAYEIVATADSPTVLSIEQAQQLLQPVLTDRFRLKFHREMREFQVYALVSGKSPPQIKGGKSS
jgi:uncharacterized protein (TIGR03435 family)